MDTLEDPDNNYILNLLECDTILIFTNSHAELEDFKIKLNSSDIPILKIGKSFCDDIFNLIFLEEKLKSKIIFLTIDYHDKNNQKIFQLSKNTNLLLKKLLDKDDKSTRVNKSIVHLINNYLLGSLVSIESFILRKKLERHFIRRRRKKNLQQEVELENFL